MKSIDEMIEVMQAYKNGAEIEVICIQDPIDNWHKVDTPIWDWNDCDYRIKKEKKYRPMTFEEIVDYWKEHRTEIYSSTNSGDEYFITGFQKLKFPDGHSEEYINIGPCCYEYKDFIKEIIKEDGTRFEVLEE